MTVALAVVGLLLRTQDVVLEPSDDVWVYQFAQDQTDDEYLRVWSGDGEAVGDVKSGSLTFSYSCLKFDLSKVPATRLTGAKLVMTHAGTAGYTAEDSKKHPLEARSLTTEWSEANWQYENFSKVHPQKDPLTIFGTGSAGPNSAAEPFKIEIDLMAGKSGFAKAFEEALKGSSKSLAMALTSALSPEGQGEGFVYRLFSKTNEETKRPKLVLTFEG